MSIYALKSSTLEIRLQTLDPVPGIPHDDDKDDDDDDKDDDDDTMVCWFYGLSVSWLVSWLVGWLVCSSYAFGSTPQMRGKSPLAPPCAFRLPNQQRILPPRPHVGGV